MAPGQLGYCRECPQPTDTDLAKGPESTHPEDAVRVYKAHVAALLRNMGKGVYEEAIRTREEIATLLARCGQEAAFRALLTEIRATRRKRNLMQMLDRKGW